MNKNIVVYFFVFSIFILQSEIVSAQADTVSIGIDAKKTTTPFTPLSYFGSPQQVAEKNFIALKKAGQLQKSGKDKQLKVLNGAVNYQLNLAGQGVALLKVSW